MPPVKRRTAATIVGVGEDFSYADALTRAGEKIPLADLGTRVRRTVNGGCIIEISSPDDPKRDGEFGG